MASETQAMVLAVNWPPQDPAEGQALPYDGETLPAIFRQSSLKNDPIHPNAQGYRKLAEAVAALLRRSGAI